MKTFQKKLKLQAYKRGFHLITNTILESIPEIKEINTGILQVFIKHTSASLTINENADPSVGQDMESHNNVMYLKILPIIFILMKVESICRLISNLH